jgi:hypothetical protein
MGKRTNAYRILDNIKMVLRDTGWVGMVWIDLAQNWDQWRALVNTVMNLRVPQNVGKFVSSCTTGVFSRRAHLHGVSLLDRLEGRTALGSPRYIGR